MQWLNINIEFLHAPEFLGSEPVARATWLCVLGYCVMQENDGRIEHGAQWGDRMWQQACGVTLEEVQESTLLITVSEDHVYVCGYPHDKQAEVQAKRKGGKVGGIKSGETRRSASSSASRGGSKASVVNSLSASPDAMNGREGKGMEEKGREGKTSEDDSVPTPPNTFKLYTLAAFRCVIAFDSEETETAQLLISKFEKQYLYNLIVKIRGRNKRNGKRARPWLSDLLEEIQEFPPQGEEIRRAN